MRAVIDSRVTRNGPPSSLRLQQVTWEGSCCCADSSQLIFTVAYFWTFNSILYCQKSGGKNLLSREIEHLQQELHISYKFINWPQLSNSRNFLQVLLQGRGHFSKQLSDKDFACPWKVGNVWQISGSQKPWPISLIPSVGHGSWLLFQSHFKY